METLGSIGETAALRRIFPRLPNADAALVGPGDDAAVLATPDGRIVITTDTMVHGPDFRLAWSTPHDLGWKAAATNLSDIAAMGAHPTALVVALVAPVDTPVAFLESLSDGLRDACDALASGAGVVGGDLGTGDTLVIAVTAFGDLCGRAPVLRSGARVGDVVAVSGSLGAAAEGLDLLFTRAMRNGSPDAELAAVLRTDPATSSPIAAQLTPHPPLSDGPAAAAAGATAMLDLSDGLALDGRRIATASGVALDLSRDAVGSALGLTGGEDHGLLATFPSDAVLPGGFRAIGVVTAGEGLLVDGRAFEARGGWDPYADWDGGRG